MLRAHPSQFSPDPVVASRHECARNGCQTRTISARVKRHAQGIAGFDLGYRQVILFSEQEETT